MCGIFGYITKLLNEGRIQELIEYSERIRHRGPDNTQYKVENVDDEKQALLGFHRLMINGLDENGNQPMTRGDITLICNGEIYNYEELIEKYSLRENYNSGSDCEVIIHLYEDLTKIYEYNTAVNILLNDLDGVFAFMLVDKSRNDVLVARDHLGVRPLYIGRSLVEGEYEYGFASEAKALVFADHLEQFPPRHWWSFKNSDRFIKYYDISTEILVSPTTEEETEEMYDNIRTKLIRAVEKRLLSERPIGCLLSGGLDSSLIASICSRFYDDPKKLKTFSIGLPGSPDVYHARLVADMIGSDHHEFQVDIQDFIDAVEDTIYTLGTYDITTIRASVGHRMVCKLLSENSDVVVLFSGETADEMGGYLYFGKAPTAEDFQLECKRLLDDIHFFDGLRSDRSISQWGLESRVPFSDREFMRYYMSIDPKLRQFGDGHPKERIEKYILRKAFEGYLPNEVLWRRKNGFSDSVSSKEKSWHSIIRQFIDTIITDEQFEEDRLTYTINQPQIKEAYYYRKIFEKHYGGRNHQTICPYMWLPKWSGDMQDPSARELDTYEAD